ncbi:HicB family protein [Clostridia bacterium]|nr:HicB family protein [Clostridia bacterium]
MDKYSIAIFKDTETNMYYAECMELKGCFTQAKNIEDIFPNMREAIELYLENNDHIETTENFEGIVSLEVKKYA